jgi:hypothetical protein
MAWTDPVRYPNFIEISDNEAFLNTYVIDNLIHLKANSGGVPSIHAYATPSTFASIATTSAGNAVSSFTFSTALAKRFTGSITGTDPIALTDTAKGWFQPSAAGMYEIQFTTTCSPATGGTTQQIAFLPQISTDGGTTWTSTSLYTAATIQQFYLGSATTTVTQTLTANFMIYAEASNLIRVAANTQQMTFTMNYYGVNYMVRKIA